MIYPEYEGTRFFNVTQIKGEVGIGNTGVTRIWNVQVNLNVLVSSLCNGCMNEMYWDISNAS